MEQIIHLKTENLKIKVDTAEEILNKYNVPLECAIAKCIKHIYRYNEINMPKNIIVSILWKAHKGIGCKKHHLDIAQRKCLYEYFKDKEIENPYIEEFVKESKEILE